MSCTSPLHSCSHQAHSSICAIQFCHHSANISSPLPSIHVHVHTTMCCYSHYSWRSNGACLCYCLPSVMLFTCMSGYFIICFYLLIPLPSSICPSILILYSLLICYLFVILFGDLS
jgi:hypothetical protein